MVEVVDKLTIDNNQYNIIIKKKRIKNTYIRVDENLNIIVTTNVLVPKIYINKLINDNIKSITKMVNTRIKKQKIEMSPSAINSNSVTTVFILAKKIK